MARIAGAMAASIAHRGPDEQNVWCEPEVGLAFGHRRLAVIDLSPAGRQPMVSASGRSVICYNGEVYNAGELKALLGNRVTGYRGHSDTEVLLEACEVLGVQEAVERAIGMFAFALWERPARRLWLVRDRLGIKPLYWARNRDGALLFASELRPFYAFPGFREACTLDRNAIALYMRHNYIPHPHTIYEGVRQLPPGHLLCFEPAGDGASDAGPRGPVGAGAGARVNGWAEPRIAPYWQLADVVRAGRAEPFEGSPEEATDSLEALLGDAVARRMVADVPLGAFLSGGIDSSTVVALMQAHAARPVRTFSIGFREEDYNEAHQAAAVARHLGTDHTELIVEPREAQAVIPQLADIYDEPFADASQVPTHLVSMLARRHVTVSLSGDGGDELFAGYNRYTQAHLFERIGHLPGALRRTLAGAIEALSPALWDQAFRLVPRAWRPRLAGDKMHKLAAVLGHSGDALHHRVASHWADPEKVVMGAREPMTVLTDPSVEALVPEPIARMQYRDTLSYLPCDILAKVDRASMAVSLEARVPLLDHRVVAFAWRLPQELKLRDGQGKWLLRQVLYRHVPKALVERPKMGFGIPIDDWLRGPLRDWAEALLDERRLREGGIFAPRPIRARWEAHLTGRRNHQYALWNVLMFEAWRERWWPG